MKKVFNHSRKPYGEEDIEWDEDVQEEYYADGEEPEDVEYYADGEETEDVEYYADGEETEDVEYYADGEEPEDVEYYADGEEPEDVEYYADGDEAEDVEYYADGEEPEQEEYYADGDDTDNGEYYADDEESEEEYYADEDEADEDDMYYADDEEYEEDRPRRRSASNNGNGEKDNFFVTLWSKFLHMHAMDRIMVSTGVLILILALVTGTIYVSASMLNKQVASFAKVGAQLDDITLIGGSGLLAVADAEMARIMSANAVEDGGGEEEDTEYNENEYEKEMQVVLSMTSIQKDLKIKFVNGKTNKLVPNVPFKVSVKTPDGSTQEWDDDDMDGIIYKKGIKSGNYTVAMTALEGEKYADYQLSTASEKVEVKDKIAYNKVDVSQEIKKESEINASKEDTMKNDTAVESALKDTVTWVESTKKLVDALYAAVPRSSITSPLTASIDSRFLRLGAISLTVGQTSPGNYDLAADASGITYTSSNTAIATVDGSGNITAVGAGEATVTASFTVSGGDAKTAICTVTVAAASVPVTGITLNAAALNVAVGGSGTLTATISPNNATNTVVTWTSADTSIATVSGGVVTGIKTGKTTITAAAGDKTVTCAVTVGTEATAIKLNQTVATLPVNGILDLTVTVEPANATNVAVTWTSSNTGIVTVDTNGRVTAKAKGTANITAQTGSLTAICQITVSDRAITLDKTAVTVLTEGTDTVKVTVNNTTGGTVEAVSSDTAKATVSVADKTITVKGVGAGTATVSIVHKENGVETKSSFTVKVKDKATKLTDATGKQLYVYTGKDGNGTDVYREAIYADYSAFDTFYLKTEGVYKYTGWQTLNGKLYYYDANGKCVTGEQVIQGAKYNFASDGSLVTGNGQFGIDVSKFNGTIDWNAVKNSGVNYVIIRCGYRGSSAGSLIEDPKFKSNIKGATAAGLKVGVYFFTQAVDEVEAVEEASMALQLIKPYKISYPVFLDVESSGGRADGLSSSARTSIIKTFCETIQNSGYTAGVYANKSWLTTKFDPSQLSKYKIWLAQYASAPTYTGRYEMWQYKSTGKVSGISGNVDLNLSYLGY